MPDYISSKQAAEKWDITQRWVALLCVQGRIPGAQKIGSVWLVPFDAERPSDLRIKSGKYIKSETEPANHLIAKEQKKEQNNG